MKPKKLHLLRPEIDIEIHRPFLGTLKLLFVLPQVVKLKKVTLDVFCGRLPLRKFSLYYLCIPKIKVVYVR